MADSYYETEAILSEYLFFHYGKKEDYLPFSEGPESALYFPKRVVEEVIQKIPPGFRFQKALDLGCAVGSSSFELSRYFKEVVGVDYSKVFIEAAQELQKKREMRISVIEEVGKQKEVLISIPSDLELDRVMFQQGDAMNLSRELSDFDLVLAVNLIDRLPDPEVFLKSIHQKLRLGGVLALATPYTWMKSFTAPEKWLSQGEGNRAALDRILLKEFTFLDQVNIPFLIREHIRKYQWTVSELTLWRRQE